MLKVCKGPCGEAKGVDAFYRKPRYHVKYPNSDAGYSHACRICTNIARKAYRLANLDKSKKIDENSRLKRTYGIDLNQYNQIFISQNGCCLGCERHQSEFSKALVVDHDHANGKVRGLLCMPCNIVLGAARDSSKTLVNLISYLDSNLSNNNNILPFSAPMKVG